MRARSPLLRKQQGPGTEDPVSACLRLLRSREVTESSPRAKNAVRRDSNQPCNKAIPPHCPDNPPRHQAQPNQCSPKHTQTPTPTPAPHFGGRAIPPPPPASTSQCQRRQPATVIKLFASCFKLNNKLHVTLRRCLLKPIGVGSALRRHSNY